MKALALRAALVAVGTLPWLRVVLARLGAGALAKAVDLAFAATCHHDPERTLTLGGGLMCVCSRCAGVYAGLALAALLPTLRGSQRFLRRAFPACAVLLLLDVVTQDAGMHAPIHAIRLATGGLVGLTLGVWAISELSPGYRFSATLSRAERSASRKATEARIA